MITEPSDSHHGLNSIIKAVLFDLGGVVFEIDWARVAVALKLEDSAHEPFILNSLSSWDPYCRYERDEISTDEFRKELEIKFQQPISNALFRYAWNSLIVGEIKGVSAVLGELPPALGKFALSNSNRAHFEYLADVESATLEKFNKVFWSFNLRARKPEAAAFLEVCTEINLRPQEVLFLDDLETNVMAAQRVGLKAELVKNSAAKMRRIFQYYQLIA